MDLALIFDLLFTYIVLYNYKIYILNTMGINISNFLSSKSKNKSMSEFQDLDHIDGVSISALSANLYKEPRDDLALFYFRNGANYASVYTCLLYTSPSPRD